MSNDSSTNHKVKIEWQSINTHADHHFFFFWGGGGGEIGKVKLSFQEKIRTWDDDNTS